ncbi:MAG: replication protein RepA [Psychrosphaera sp.]|nr:replication protein RepA [Psychrosphaera sp.]
MSLLDLKKDCTPSKTVQCTVDEFIDNAQNYARGFDNVYWSNPKQPDKVNVDPPTVKQPFRKATFTLSESCIDSLTEQSQQTGCAKSHLMRMLIHQLETMDPAQRQLLINRYKNFD